MDIYIERESGRGSNIIFTLGLEYIYIPIPLCLYIYIYMNTHINQCIALGVYVVVSLFMCVPIDIGLMCKRI